jgi:hypothetical protein
MSILRIFLFGILTLVYVPVHADLIDLKNGRIYDTDLKISWLKDANLAATNTFGVSGIGPGGDMDWCTAQQWIAAMNRSSYMGFSTWRLPDAHNPDGSGPSLGYNADSEMGHLYYKELGNVPISLVPINTGPFLNVVDYVYWSGTRHEPTAAWAFFFGTVGGTNPGTGYQGYQYEGFHQFIWPVLEGEVETVLIDIEPNKHHASINLHSHGEIAVAILSTPEFYAPDIVDKDSLTFGPTGNEDSLTFCYHRPEDVNGDSLKDLLCYFYSEDTGFQCGDTKGTLKGKTKDGIPIEGSDSVKIAPCK